MLFTKLISGTRPEVRAPSVYFFGGISSAELSFEKFSYSSCFLNGVERICYFFSIVMVVESLRITEVSWDDYEFRI